ncbi:MAG: hypothetical protein SO359_05170 [Prevotella sp.]|nr:hypothetical protein [Prevotella sp.]
MHRVQGNKDTARIECVNPVKNKWRIRWDYQQREDGTTDFMEAEFPHKPSVEEVRALVIQWYNDDTDRRILSGFAFEGSTVWLSAENQLNYKAAFDLAVQTNGASLPVTIKLGTDDKPVYRVFSQLEDFRTFYTAALTYIQQTIADGWKVKDAFKMEDYVV